MTDGVTEPERPYSFTATRYSSVPSRRATMRVARLLAPVVVGRDLNESDAGLAVQLQEGVEAVAVRDCVDRVHPVLEHRAPRMACVLRPDLHRPCLPRLQPVGCPHWREQLLGHAVGDVDQRDQLAASAIFVGTQRSEGAVVGPVVRGVPLVRGVAQDRARWEEARSCCGPPCSAAGRA